MADDFPIATSTTGIIALGSSASGGIETPGDRDWFRVSLIEGTRYQFYLGGSQVVNTGPAGGTLSDPVLTLLNSAGVQISQNNDGTFARNASIVFVAPATGDYFLEAASASSADTGTYLITAKPYVSAAEMAREMTGDYWRTKTPPVSRPNVTVNFSTLSATEQELAAQALQLYASVGNLSFSVVTGTADLVFSNAGSGMAQGGHGAVQVSADIVTGPGFATHAFQLYLHEVGHALGLGHPGPYNSAPQFGLSNVFANDGLQYSVMSDFGWPGTDLHGRILTPQMADIYAIQLLYGVNATTHLGDTVYGFNSNVGTFFDFNTYGPKVSFTIYDSGGLDTIDASRYSNSQRLDLTPGNFSSVGGYADNIGIYLTTIVENAVGGAGADEIIGNQAPNQITGGAGNDVLEGGEGTDTAVYSGASAGYIWTKSTGGAWTVQDMRANSPDGVDTLRNVEILRFSDMSVTLDAGTSPATSLASVFANILRQVAPSGASLALETDLERQIAAGTVTNAQAITQIVNAAEASTSVATLTYQFFTGRIPSQAGIDYLVSPTGPNPNNLNSAYYQSFNIENRYINFAVNLGKLGDGKDGFAAAYGGKSLLDTVKSAYATIFGSTPSDTKVHALVDSRADYFATYGQDGLTGIGTKAAAVGWLLAEAAKADLGMYSKANDAFLSDLADGATFAVDIVGVYGKPEFVYHPG